MPAFPKPIHLSHQFIRSVASSGDTVVDATLGNGHDALFLARLVGDQGEVIGFDIQADAVESARDLMIKNAVNTSSYRFFHAGHECMAEHVTEEVSVVMFNLGYLPNADKSVITEMDTTLAAIEQAISLLKVGGLISIMCYPGHSGGDTESAAVKAFCASLEREKYRVAEYGLVNAPNNPPFLLLIEKLSPRN